MLLHRHETMRVFGMWEEVGIKPNLEVNQQNALWHRYYGIAHIPAVLPSLLCRLYMMNQRAKAKMDPRVVKTTTIHRTGFRAISGSALAAGDVLLWWKTGVNSIGNTRKDKFLKKKEKKKTKTTFVAQHRLCVIFGWHEDKYQDCLKEEQRLMDMDSSRMIPSHRFKNKIK